MVENHLGPEHLPVQEHRIRKILKAAGYKRVGSFQDQRTRVDYSVYARNLSEDDIYPKFQLVLSFPDPTAATIRLNYQEKPREASMQHMDIEREERQRLAEFVTQRFGTKPAGKILARAINTEILFGTSKAVAGYKEIHGRPLDAAHRQNVKRGKPRGPNKAIAKKRRQEARTSFEVEEDYED